MSELSIKSTPAPDTATPLEPADSVDEVDSSQLPPPSTPRQRSNSLTGPPAHPPPPLPRQPPVSRTSAAPSINSSPASDSYNVQAAFANAKPHMRQTSAPALGATTLLKTPPGLQPPMYSTNSNIAKQYQAAAAHQQQQMRAPSRNDNYVMAVAPQQRTDHPHHHHHQPHLVRPTDNYVVAEPYWQQQNGRNPHVAVTRMNGGYFAATARVPDPHGAGGGGVPPSPGYYPYVVQPTSNIYIEVR